MWGEEGQVGVRHEVREVVSLGGKRLAMRLWKWWTVSVGSGGGRKLWVQVHRLEASGGSSQLTAKSQMKTLGWLGQFLLHMPVVREGQEGREGREVSALNLDSTGHFLVGVCGSHLEELLPSGGECHSTCMVSLFRMPFGLGEVVVKRVVGK